MNEENEKKFYTILTNRTQHQCCRYVVEATSPEQANHLFEDGAAKRIKANAVENFEGVLEIYVDVAQKITLAGGAES